MMKNSNKFKLGISIGLVVLVFCIALASYIYVDYQKLQERRTYTYESKQEALSGGIKEVEKNFGPEGLLVEPSSIEDKVVLETKHKGSWYQVIKMHYVEAGMHKDNIYIAKVEEKEGFFRFKRVTSFFALNTPGDVADIEYTPFAQISGIEVDSLEYAVGKVYNLDYTPYLNGKVLPMDKEGIYVAVGKNKAPVIKVKGE